MSTKTSVIAALAALAVGCGDGGGGGSTASAGYGEALKQSSLALEAVASIRDLADLPALAVRAGDLDGDGKTDLAVLKASLAGGSGAPSLVDVFAGPVTADDPVPLETHLLMPGARDLDLADLDGDGTLDLAAAIRTTPSAAGRIHLLIRRPGGGLGWQASVLDGLDALRVRAADVDGDGRADILAEGADGSVRLARNLGAGVFAPGTLAAEGSGLTAADVDGDGAADLVLISAAGLAVHRWDAARGAMASAAEIALDLPAQAICAGDVDGDGLTDLAAGTDDGLRVARGAGGFAFRNVRKVGDGWTLHVAAGDFDGDGLADIGRNTFSNGFQLQAIFPDAGGYASTPALGLSVSLHGMTAADVTGDGKADLIVAGERVAIYRCN